MPRATDVILETHGLTKEFRGFVAVRHVNLRVRRGTIHALIGPNGAGKTTCFNLLTHFLAPTAGRIAFNGRDITGSRPADIARLGLVRSFQISAVFPHLSVLENVRIALPAPARALVRLLALRARARRPQRAGARAAGRGRASAPSPATPAVELPYGRKRALEIATTLALDPEMMLLDEPTAGMAHEDVGRISAPHQEGRGQPHGADGRAQPERGGEPLRHDHRAVRAARSWPRATTRPSPAIPT